MMEQKQHNIDADSSFEQETDAINIGYTVGGITLGFQDASTDHANMVKNKRRHKNCKRKSCVLIVNIRILKSG